MVTVVASVQFICCADNTLVVGWADTIAEVEHRVNQALDSVWKESARLNVAVEKTEAMLFTTQGVDIKVGKTLKYLEMRFDEKLRDGGEGTASCWPP